MARIFRRLIISLGFPSVWLQGLVKTVWADIRLLVPFPT
jgi:hypothetical protein